MAGPGQVGGLALCVCGLGVVGGGAWGRGGVLYGNLLPLQAAFAERQGCWWGIARQGVDGNYVLVGTG